MRSLTYVHPHSIWKYTGEQAGSIPPSQTGPMPNTSSRLVDARLRLEGCPREPEMVHRDDGVELLPDQLPANSLAQHIPRTAGLGVDDPIAGACKSQTLVIEHACIDVRRADIAPAHDGALVQRRRGSWRPEHDHVRPADGVVDHTELLEHLIGIG